jgi:hypothetical protein
MKSLPSHGLNSKKLIIYLEILTDGAIRNLASDPLMQEIQNGNYMFGPVPKSRQIKLQDTKKMIDAKGNEKTREDLTNETEIVSLLINTTVNSSPYSAIFFPLSYAFLSPLHSYCFLLILP